MIINNDPLQTNNIRNPTPIINSNGVVTGNISLTVDNGSPISQALVNGSSTFTIPSPPAGNHSLSANYAAQGSFLLHTSDIQAQLRRSNGSSITAGTSPDDDQTMLYWHKLDFGLCPLILQLVPRKAVRLTWDWTSGPICSSFRLCRMLPRTRCRALPPKPGLSPSKTL